MSHETADPYREERFPGIFLTQIAPQSALSIPNVL